MQGQMLRTTDTAPTIELFFFSTTDGSPVTTLTHSTAGLTIAYRRGITAVTSITLVTQTATGAWAAGGFVHLGGGVYRLDLPTAATASGLTDVTILASALPAATAMNACVVALTPDDLTVAAPTDSTITSAVWSAGTRTLTSGGSSAPTAAENAAAVRTNLATELARLDAPVSGALSSATLTGQLTTLRQALSVGARFGGPVAGGSSSVLPVYDAGNSAVLLGTVIVYRDSTGAVVGQSELTPP
jgi:hypothetical protein